MQIFCCQCDVAWERKTENLSRVESMIDSAAPPRESLVILPEMFATGFSMNLEVVAEPEGGPTEISLRRLAERHHIFLVGGLARTVDGGKRLTYNEALVLNPSGKVAARYQKIQPFTHGGESDHFEAGSGPVIFSWREIRVALFICYDLRFPEHFRRATALGQPELFVVIASWPAPRIHHWIRLLQARAIENQAYVAGVNRCGTDPQHQYPGRSVIVDFHGNILVDAGEGEGIISAKIDSDKLRQYRRDLPFLADMRPEVFERNPALKPY